MFRVIGNGSHPFNLTRRKQMKVSGTGNFVPAPDGQHIGVLADVVDLGEQPTKFGPKHMVRLVYQIDENMVDDAGEDTGKPFMVSGRFNATLAERASLRKHLEGLRGVKFTPEELEDFEIDDLIGTNGLLNIVHNKTEKGTFANIDAVLPYNKKFGDKLEVAPDFVRKKDQKDFSTTA
jgi:hypothetical protein